MLVFIEENTIPLIACLLQTNHKLFEEKMKLFQMKVKVPSLRVKVKFPCSISLALKYHSRQYPIFSEQPLANGQLSSPLRSVSSLEAEYDQKQGRISNSQKIALLLYLHSSHGKLLIGSYTYQLNELYAPKTYRQKIKNSPDSQAEIILQLEALFSSSSALQNRERPISAIKEQQKYSDYEPIKREVTSEDKRTRIKSQKVEVGSDKFDLMYQSNMASQKSALMKTKRRNGDSPQKNILLKSNVFDKQSDRGSYYSKSPLEDGRGRVEALKRKVSQMRLTNGESNQKYLKTIMSLEKQAKVSHQRINRLELDIRIKDSNLKVQQKEVASRKQRIESIQSELKTLQLKVANSEQKTRQYQYQIKHLSEANKSLQQSIAFQSKRLDKKEQYFKEQISQINKKAYELQKQREQSSFKVVSLNSQIDSNRKKAHEQQKQKDKKNNQERQILNKKIATLELQIHQCRHQNSSLSNDIQLLQKQLKDGVNYSDRLQRQNSKLKKQGQQLMMVQRGLQMDKISLQMELKEQHQINQENKGLRVDFEEKRQENQILTKKLLRYEEELMQSDNKIKALVVRSQGVEEDYQKLYYEKVGDSQQLERKTGTIETLILQNQQFQKTIQKLTMALYSQQQQSTDAINELRKNCKRLEDQVDGTVIHLKETRDEMLEQVQRHKNTSKQLSEAKRKLQEYQFQTEKLESEANTGHIQKSHLQGLYQLLQQKYKNISSRLSQFKQQAQVNEERLKKEVQELEADFQRKEGQIESNQEVMSKLNEQLQRIKKQVESLNLNIEGKAKDIQDLTLKLSLTQKQLDVISSIKLSLQQNNSEHKTNLIQLYQKIEQLQAQLSDHKSQLQVLQQALKAPSPSIQIYCDGKESSQQNRLKRIEMLFAQLSNKQKILDEAHNTIEQLQGDLHQTQNLTAQLKQELLLTKDNLSALTNKKSQLEQFVHTQIDLLQKQLMDQGINSSGFQQFSFNRNDDQDLKEMSHQLSQLDFMVGKLVKEKNKLFSSLQFKQKQVQELTIDLKTTKQMLNSLTSDADELNKKLTTVVEQDSDNKSSMRKLRDRTQEINKHNNRLEAELREQRVNNMKLTQESKQLQDRINRLTLQVQKKELLLRENEEQAEAKDKQWLKKVTALRNDISQKTKQLTLLENEKKNRIQTLNQTVDQLRRENYDLQAIAFSQKSNNSKLNSILQQLNNYVPKIEKAHSIKAYYMMPMKDLLLKFEQVMRASDKMYNDYERKLDKIEKGIDSKTDSIMKKKFSHR